LTPIDDSETRQVRIIAGAEQHFATGQHARARRLLEELLTELPRGPIRARALAQLGWFRNDDFELGTALLREELAEAGDDHRLCAEIEMYLGEVCANIGDFVGQVEHAAGLSPRTLQAIAELERRVVEELAGMVAPDACRRGIGTALLDAAVPLYRGPGTRAAGKHERML